MINIDLNEELGTKIFSFPMRFIPLYNTNRRYVGEYWTKKQLRAIQVILNATHGVVGPKREFIQRAFSNVPIEVSKKETIPYEELLEGFLTLLWMPEDYIMYREKHAKSDAVRWRDEFESLSESDRKILKEIIKDDIIDVTILKQKGNAKIRKILRHYNILRKRTQSRLENFIL